MDVKPQGPEDRNALSFLGRSALLNALGALEAIVAFLMDVVIAVTFGMGTHSDALYAALALPQKIGRGVFQNLTNSFMGLFGGSQESGAAYNQAITVITVATLPLAAALSVTSEWWLPLTIPGATAEIQAAAVPLSRVLVWMIGLVPLSETLRAVYYQKGRVWLPSLTRLVGGGLAIALILAARGGKGLALAAWGVTIGTAVEAIMALILMPVLLGVRFRPSWPPKERLREMIRVVGVPLSGQGAYLLSGLGEQVLSSLLPAGGITAANYAKRIMNTLERFVFRGFIITTIRSHAAEDRPDLRTDFRMLMLFSMPIVLLLGVLSRPFVAVVFARGRFGPEDVGTLAMTLQVYAPAVLIMAVSRIPVGLAYAQKRVRAILGNAVSFSVVLVLAEALFIYLGLGLRSFGLGYAVAALAGLVSLYVSLLRGQKARIWDRLDTARLLAVGLAAAIGTVLPSWAAGLWTSPSVTGSMIVLVAGAAGCVAFMAAAAYALRMDEARQVLGLFKRLRPATRRGGE